MEVSDGIVSNLREITIATWVKPDQLRTWSRVFDFGTNTNLNMFLTPQNGANGRLRFAITRTGASGEQRIDGTAPLPAATWSHVAVTLSGGTGILYLDGEEVGRNENMTLTPADLGFTAYTLMGWVNCDRAQQQRVVTSHMHGPEPDRSCDNAVRVTRDQGQAGHRIDAVYADVISGKTPALERPEFAKMIDAIARGRRQHP